MKMFFEINQGKRFEEADSLWEVVTRCNKMDRITLCKGKFNSWRTCHDGVVVLSGNEFLVNGVDRISGIEPTKKWDIHPEGIITQKNSSLLLDGNLLVEDVSDCSWWSSHYLSGIICKNIKGLLLNFERFICPNNFDTWRHHPKGVAIKRGNKILLNDDEVIFEGVIDIGVSFKFSSFGIITQRYNQLLLNDCKVIFEGKIIYWEIHEYGVVIHNKDGFFLIIMK